MNLRIIRFYCSCKILLKSCLHLLSRKCEISITTWLLGEKLHLSSAYLLTPLLLSPGLKNQQETLCISLYTFTWRPCFIRFQHPPFLFYLSSILESCSIDHTLMKTCPNTMHCSSLAELPPAPKFAFPHLHVCHGVVLRVQMQCSVNLRTLLLFSSQLCPHTSPASIP